MIRKWFKNKIIEHSTKMTGVVPEHKWSDKDRAFFLNSSAGLIKYKPKNTQDTARFRDKYINQFEAIKSSQLAPEIKEELFFRLYSNIRSAERVNYSANIRTRIQGVVCNL